MNAAHRANAVNAAVNAAISARNLCGIERDAIADVADDYAVAFTPRERAEIAVKVAATWNAAREAAGVTRFARASDYRALS